MKINRLDRSGIVGCFPLQMSNGLSFLFTVTITYTDMDVVYLWSGHQSCKLGTPVHQIFQNCVGSLLHCWIRSGALECRDTFHIVPTLEESCTT